MEYDICSALENAWKHTDSVALSANIVESKTPELSQTSTVISATIQYKANPKSVIGGFILCPFNNPWDYNVLISRGVYVCDAYRTKGYGKAMLAARVAVAKEFHLTLIATVAKDNLVQKYLLTTFGWSRVCEIRSSADLWVFRG